MGSSRKKTTSRPASAREKIPSIKLGGLWFSPAAARNAKKAAAAKTPAAAAKKPVSAKPAAKKPAAKPQKPPVRPKTAAKKAPVQAKKPVPEKKKTTVNKISTSASAKKAPAKKPAAPVKKPATPAKKPTPPAKKPAPPAKKPAAPAKKPAPPAKKPAAPAKKPAPPAKKPSAPAKKPSAPATKPAAPAKKPAAPAKKDVSSQQKPAEPPAPKPFDPLDYPEFDDVPQEQPVDDEPFTEEELDRFRENLRVLRAKLSGKAQSLQTQSLHRYDEVNNAEDGTDAMTRNTELKKAALDEDQIKQIDTALVALGKGTYGICQNCGHKIGTRRLLAIPFAKFCIQCQSEMEEEAARRGPAADSETAAYED